MNRFVHPFKHVARQITRPPQTCSKPFLCPSASSFIRCNSSTAGPSSVAPEPPAEKKTEAVQAADEFSDEESEQDFGEDEGDFPNLLRPDPLMDSSQTAIFEPTARIPYESKVIVRNDPSMFMLYRQLEEEQDARFKPTPIPDEQDVESWGGPFPFLHVTRAQFNTFHNYALVRTTATQQTGKGKIRRARFLVVIGNGDGLVGYGEGKDPEATKARAKANLEALRNMDHVERFENRTFWTEMEGKMGGTRIILRPRPVGFGLHCNPYVHQVLKAAGIKDASAKVWGSRNSEMVVKLLFKMLHSGSVPLGMGDGVGGGMRNTDKGRGMRGKDDIERERGRRLVNLWN